MLKRGNLGNARRRGTLQSFKSPYKTSQRKSGKVRYGVVGLGHIAQVAVLPAFKNAARNSELVALFSGDPKKEREIGRKYRVPIVGWYEGSDSGLRNRGM